MILAGDVGGTKINLALFDSTDRLHDPVMLERFSSTEIGSLADAVVAFLGRINVPMPDAACIGVAGPVIDGQAFITNLDWIVDTDELKDATSIPKVRLINDLQALAISIPHLRTENLITVQEGQRREGGARAIIAPGTGLGEAYATWDGEHYVAHPSEGGHSDFCPNDQVQAELLLYLLDRFSRVSVERVCSGSGFPNIHDFLRDRANYEEPAWLREKMDLAKDPTPVLFEAALDKTSPTPICLATLDLFLRILGAESGNMALNLLAQGGVYLGGGIPPRLIDQIKNGPFLEAFHNKGRLRDMMESFPIQLIDNPRAGLIGAAAVAFASLAHGRV